MYKYKKSIFDKYPLLGFWLLGLAFFLLLTGLGIFQLNIKPSLDNLEKTSGTIIEHKKKTKYQDQYIILGNNEKYYIYNESSWATDYSFDKELIEGYIVEIQYINNKYKEVVSLKVNDKNLYSLEDYKIGFREYHNFLHILFMIIAILIMVGLLGITVYFYKPIKMDNKPKKLKDNFWSRLSPKTKVIIGVALFILGFGYFFLCLGIYGGSSEGISMDNYPFIFVSMMVVPFILFIISIVIISKNEYLIKPTKNAFLKAINPKKENVYIEFVGAIILLVMGIIGAIYVSIEEPDPKYIISCIFVLIVGIIGSINYSKKIYKIRKDKKYYSKKDFVPKNLYEQLRNDLYKKQLKKQIRNLTKDFEIDSDYDQELKQIKISFKNKFYEITITIEKNNKWIDVILDNELETKLYEIAEKGFEELTVDVLDKLLYDEEKVKLSFDKNDLSKTYIGIVNKIKEKQEYIEKLRELIIF